MNQLFALFNKEVLSLLFDGSDKGIVFNNGLSQIEDHLEICKKKGIIKSYSTHKILTSGTSGSLVESEAEIVGYRIDFELINKDDDSGNKSLSFDCEKVVYYSVSQAPVFMTLGNHRQLAS